MRLLGLSSSIRVASFNQGLLRVAMKQSATMGATMEIADLANLPLFCLDLLETDMPPPPALAKFFEQLASSDAVLFASAEYPLSPIRGVPAPLKNALDWGSMGKLSNFQPLTNLWNHKTAAIIGAGWRVQPGHSSMNLREICGKLGIFMVRSPDYAIDVSGISKETRRKVGGNIQSSLVNTLVENTLYSLKGHAQLYATELKALEACDGGIKFSPTEGHSNEGHMAQPKNDDINLTSQPPPSEFSVSLNQGEKEAQKQTLKCGKFGMFGEDYYCLFGSPPPRSSPSVIGTKATNLGGKEDSQFASRLYQDIREGKMSDGVNWGTQKSESINSGGAQQPHTTPGSLPPLRKEPGSSYEDAVMKNPLPDPPPLRRSLNKHPEPPYTTVASPSYQAGEMAFRSSPKRQQWASTQTQADQLSILPRHLLNKVQNFNHLLVKDYRKVIGLGKRGLFTGGSAGARKIVEKRKGELQRLAKKE